MNIEKLRKNLESRGFSLKYFETGAEAVEYINGEVKDTTVGIGGSKTIEALGLYEKLSEKNDVAWHWRQPPAEAHARAAVAEVYMCSANGIAETGEIINIDGTGNRIASTVFKHEKLYIIAGVNKVAEDFEKALWRARNVAAPLNAKRFNLDTPCAISEKMRCYDCSNANRICRGLTVLWKASNGIGSTEVIIINEELGF